jgi:2-polyprenyl-3-methyl-5-hydroxy-6-metoxy-1,4-benzoquinol methylase
MTRSDPETLRNAPANALAVPVAQCPICGATGQRKGEVYNSWQLSECPGCGFTYTAVRKMPEGLYQDEYEQDGAYLGMLATARRTAAGEWGFHQLWWFKRLGLKWLEGMTNGRRLVEIGCGPGTFLMVAKSRGWDVTGVEPAAPAAKQATEFGLAVTHGYVEPFVAANARPFDAAALFEVLEHVPDPIAVLRAIRSLIVPGGAFVMSVPNLDDPYCLKQQIRSAMPPVHINFFNRRSLRKALESAGFEVVRFKSLPIPSSSVRNVHGKGGFILRVPFLCVASLFGKADGTTLVAMARRPVR